ncbi:hypothetical protein R3P38DRAFT_3249060, partial [Favolaschia claudopus]
MFSLTHLLALLIHPLLPLTQAASLSPANITIDDTNTIYFSFDEGPVVLENPFWVPASVSDPCGYCSAQPGIVSSPGSILNQTWHDGRSGATGTFRFQGSAVYIYGIDILSSANMSFSLDSGSPVYHHYDGLNQFVFHSLFFSAESLKADIPHTLSWVLNTPNTNNTAAASGLFDYAVITMNGANGTTVTDPPQIRFKHCLFKQHMGRLSSPTNCTVGPWGACLTPIKQRLINQCLTKQRNETSGQTKNIFT